MKPPTLRETIAKFIAKGSIGFETRPGRRRKVHTFDELLARVDRRRRYGTEYMRQWRKENPERHRENSRNGMRKLRAKLALNRAPG